MSLERKFSKLLNTPSENVEVPGMVQSALQVATLAHEGQTRKSGEPYISHPIAVESIIHNEWGIENSEMRAAALLHDTIEDTSLTLAEITSAFGPQVANLVFSETNLNASTAGVTSEEWSKIKDRENQRKILSRSFLDPRVGVGKLADRLHNMRTLESMSLTKQQQIADETRRVYVPLAEALGMWLVKNELEDLSFYYLDHEFFLKIKNEIDSDQRLSEYSIGFWESRLKLILDENNLIGDVHAKQEGYWSIINKRRKQTVFRKSSLNDFADINDVVSYRITLDREGECYQLFGFIHKELGAFIDFGRDDIFMYANKRDNGYQALQTTLTTSEGDIEIAVMTSEMEEFNNWGAVSVLRKAEREPGEYRLKLVFTPSEDVVFLRPQATGIDFAYKISDSLGADATGLLIDGKKYPVTTIIPNATVVEVLTSDETKTAPDRIYLNYSLPETQRIINRQLIISENQKTVSDTKTFLSENVLHQRGLLNFEDLEEGVKKQILNRFGVIDFDSLFLKYAENKSIDRLVQKINHLLDILGINKGNTGLTTILVKGTDTPGVLAEISNWIIENNGNVRKVHHATEGFSYELRLVVEKIGVTGEQFIKEKLEKDSRFDKWKVV